VPVDERVKVQLAQLFQAHGARLRAVLARLAGPAVPVDDLLQEVFVIALAKIDRFGSQGPPVPWLYGVANHVASAARRRECLRRFLGLEEAHEPVGPGTPQSLFERAESAQRVYGVLERISEKKRTVFILYELEGLTGEEIAQALHVPLKTVWTRLVRARSEFAEGMRRDEARALEQEALTHERA
jgi:RNA polymerase sigma-70 factor (ECF subfamily)